MAFPDRRTVNMLLTIVLCAIGFTLIDSARRILLIADLLRAREPMLPSMVRPGLTRVVTAAAIGLILLHFASHAVAQNTPLSPDHPWHGPEERRIEADTS
jgi:hypothetical protein